MFSIDKYPETLHPRFNTPFITGGIELVLNNNSFQFNKKNYIQTHGTAMGNKIAPTYATLTLIYLEDNLYDIIGKKYSNNIKQTLLDHRNDTLMIALYFGKILMRLN